MVLLRSTLLGLLLAAAPAAAQEAVVSGRVTSTEGGAPIAGARIELVRGGAALSDADGRFRLPAVAAGEYLLRVQVLGFGGVEEMVQLRPGAMTVDLALEPEPIALEPVAVRGTGNDPTGFHARRTRHAGSGRFIGVEEIRARRASTLADVLRSSVPGIRLVPGANGASHAASGSQHGPGFLVRGGSGACYADVFVDGIRVSGARGGPVDLRDYPPEFIEAVEYYRHASSTPPQFRIGDPQCGTLVIWTRRAVPSDGW